MGWQVYLPHEVLDTAQLALDAGSVQQGLPHIIAPVPLWAQSPQGEEQKCKGTGQPLRAREETNAHPAVLTLLTLCRPRQPGKSSSSSCWDWLSSSARAEPAPR